MFVAVTWKVKPKINNGLFFLKVSNLFLVKKKKLIMSLFGILLSVFLFVVQ